VGADDTLGFVWFDIYRNLGAFSNYSKPRFTLRGRQLELSNVPVPPPRSFLEGEVYRSKALDLVVILHERLRRASGLSQSRAEKITRAIFDELVATTRRSGAVPIFVYLPVLDEILNPDEALTTNERFLLTYCEERRVPCLFLRQRFLEERRKGAEFNVRSHWFANSHLTAARRIAEYLQENRLLQPGEAAGLAFEAPITLR